MAVWSKKLRIVLLSGPICSGKSALVRLLNEKHGAKIVKTRELILKKAPKTKPERKALQRAGQRLDQLDGGILGRRGTAANSRHQCRGTDAQRALRSRLGSYLRSDRRDTTSIWSRCPPYPSDSHRRRTEKALRSKEKRRR